MKQTTLKDKFTFSGIGLHSGKTMDVTVHPAGSDTGIRFKRADVKNCPFMKVSAYNVSSTQLATTISCGDFPISTIEHLMSALYGLGVDNADIEVAGPEVPILDGSALPIAGLICDTGVVSLPEPRRYMKILKKVELEQDDKYIFVSPDNCLRITFEIDYPHNAIGRQVKELVLTPENYMNVIANARTFGFKKDVEMLYKMGLAKGGSIDNAIVLDDSTDAILNPDGLRSKDEFVNHKILDLIGDFSLTGYRIVGHIFAKKSGHHVNNLFARRLLESLNSFEISNDPFCSYGDCGDFSSSCRSMLT